MVCSATTLETYSDQSNEANVVSWHEEMLNTTQFVNIDNFGNNEGEYDERIESSEGEYDERKSIDVGKNETKHYSFDVEIIYGDKQRKVNCEEQTRNIENPTPEILDVFMKNQETLTSKHVSYQPIGKSFLDHGDEMETSINIPECITTSNAKANAWQHHSSQISLECLLSSSCISKTDGLNVELIAHPLNTNESKEISTHAATGNGNKLTKVTEPSKDKVCAMKDRILMDTEMEFTDAIHINYPNIGSHKSQVNNDMDLSKGIFCRGASSSNEKALGYANLDESEIEFTNMVGHIAASASQNTLNSISEINTLKYDGGSFKNSLNAQNNATTFTHKINAYHLQPTSTITQGSVKMASKVNCYKMCAEAAAAVEEKRYALEKSDDCSRVESRDAENLKSFTNAFQRLSEKKKECIDDLPHMFADHHAEFVDPAGFRITEGISRISKIKENVSKSTTSTSDANCIELMNCSWLKLGTAISQSSQRESIDVERSESAVQLYDDNSQLEFTGNIRCESSVKDFDDSQLEFTDVAVCNPFERQAVNISNNKQINDNDGQVKHTDMIHCQAFGKVSDDCMEFTAAAEFKIPAKSTQNSDQELGVASSYKGYCTTLDEMDLEFTNIIVDKQNSKTVMEFDGTHNIYKELTEVNNLETISDAVDHRQAKFSKLESCIPPIHTLSGIWTEFTNVNCMPALEYHEDSCLEITDVGACKPIAEITGISSSKERQCHPNEQNARNGLRSSDNSLEFTNVVRHKTPAKESVGSQSDVTNTDMCISPLRDVDVDLEITTCSANTNISGVNDSKESEVIHLEHMHSNNSNSEIPYMLKLTTVALDGRNYDVTNSQSSAIRLGPASEVNLNSCINMRETLRVACDTNMEYTGLGKPTTNISSNHICGSITGEMDYNFSRTINSNQLELTNMTEIKPVAESHGSKTNITGIQSAKVVEEVNSTDPIAIVEINNGIQYRNYAESQMELTAIKSQPEYSAKYSYMECKENIDESIELINKSKSKSAAKIYDTSCIELTDIVWPKLATEIPHSSQRESIDVGRNKSVTEKSLDNQLEFTDVIKCKSNDASQLEFTNTTVPVTRSCGRNKSVTEKSVDNQLEFTDVIKCKSNDDSQLEFTNATVPVTRSCGRNKSVTEKSVDNQLEFTDVIKCKSNVKNFDDSQLEFTNTTVPVTRSCGGNKSVTEKSVDNQLEFTDVIKCKSNVKNFDDSQLEFTNITVPVTRSCGRNKSVTEKSVDNQLEFTDVIKCKSNDDSQLEFTNAIVSVTRSSGSKTKLIGTEPSKTVEKDVYCEPSDVTNSIQCRKNLENQMELKNIKMHPYYPTKGSFLERKEAVDGSLESLNENKSKSIINISSTSGIELTNESGSKLAIDISQISQRESIDAGGSKSMSKISDDRQLKLMDITCKSPQKNFNSTQLEFTNVTFPVAESCGSKTKIIGVETSKAVEEDNCIVIMDITNGIQCRKSLKCQMEPIKIECHPGNFNKGSSVVRKEVDKCIELLHENKSKSIINISGSRGVELTNASRSNLATEIGQFNQRKSIDDGKSKSASEIFNSSQLQFINVTVPVAESCESKKQTIGFEPSKVIVDNYIAPSVIITNGMQCKRDQESKTELINIKSRPEYSIKNSSLDREENADGSIEALNNSKTTRNINHTELMKTSCLKTATEISHNSQKELIDVGESKSNSEMSDDNQLEYTHVTRCKSSVKNFDDSQLEFTGLTVPVVESHGSKMDIIAKAVEEDNDIQPTVNMNLTNGVQCRKKPENQMELTNINIPLECSIEGSSLKQKENVTGLIPNLRAKCTVSNRKRNANEELSQDYPADTQPECSNIENSMSAENNDAQVVIGAKVDESENFPFKSFNETQLKLTATTEFPPQQSDFILPNHFSSNLVDINLVNSEKAKNASGCILYLASGKSDINWEESEKHPIDLSNDKFSIKQGYASQVSGTSECNKHVKDSPRQGVLQEIPQHFKGIESDSLGQFKDSNVQQPSTSIDIAVTEKNVASKKEEVVKSATGALHTSNNRQERHALKKAQAEKNNLNVTVLCDEAFMFESIASNLTDTVNIKLQTSKQKKNVDRCNSSSSFPKRICLDTGPGTYDKITEEDEKNEKIEHMQTEDTNMNCEPEHVLLVEDEFITKIDEPICNYESEVEAVDSLMKSILDADRSLFSSLSNASPVTELSSSAVANAKERLVEEMHPNLQQKKELVHNSEPEMLTEEEITFADGQLPDICVLKQSSDISETRMEVCHISVDTDLISFPAAKEVTAVRGNHKVIEEVETSAYLYTTREESEGKLADTEISSRGKESKNMYAVKENRKAVEVEISTALNTIREKTGGKITDIEATDRVKEADQLPNTALVHMKLNDGETVEQIAFKSKAEYLKANAVNVGQPCVAVIQEPLSLEEWLKSGKHEWVIKELSSTQWHLLFLYKSLGLILKLDGANTKDGTKQISDILLESYVTESSAPEAHFVHRILLKKLSKHNLKMKFKVTTDVPELLDLISKMVIEMKLFIKDYIFMETCKLMEMKHNSVSFKMSDMHIHAVFCISVDLSNWENIKPENVTVEDVMGTVNKKEIQNLVNAIPKGPTFLSEYVNIVREYVSVLSNKI